MSYPSLSVIVPAFERPEALEICLDGIAHSNHAPDEVIVVDDGSDEDLRSVVEKHGCTYHRLTENSGQATARNAGAWLATKDVLYFVDSDIRIHEDAIEIGLRALRDPDKSVVQGCYSRDSLTPGFGPRLVAGKLSYMENRHGDASFVHSQAFMVRRELFMDLGGFNQSFKPPGGGEEFELGHRIRARHTIHTVREMVVDHHFPGVWRRGILLFHRAAAWAGLFLKTKELTKVNASPNEIITGGLTWLCFLLMLASPWQPILLWGAGAALAAGAWLGRDYLSYSLEHESAALLPALLATHLFWSAMAVAGGAWGLLCAPFARGLELVRAARFVFSRLPTQVVFFVTARCNARCGHCFYWNEIENADRASELSLDEIEKVAKGFGHIKLLALTGGEPTLRGDLPRIVQIFRKYNGLDHVSVHTNGLRSAEIIELVKRMARENPEVEVSVAVSIDGFESTHDEVRGIPGLFQSCLTTLAGLIRAKESFSNLNVTVNSCFNKSNQDELTGVIDFFESEFDLDGFYVSLVRGQTKDTSLREIDLRKYREVIAHRENSSVARSGYTNFALGSFKQTLEFLTPELVVETIERGETVYPCTAGKNIVVIDEYGEVSPCEMLSKKFGNLRDADYSISKLLTAAHGRSVRKFISDRNCACTWECAQINSTMFNWQAYPRFFTKWVRLRARSRALATRFATAPPKDEATT